MKVTSYDPLKQQVIECLQRAKNALVSGRLDAFQPDPFYERGELLTDDLIDQWMKSIVDYLQGDLNRSPGFHNNAQQLRLGEKLIVPWFDRMPREAKRRLAQDIDRLMQAYREPGS